MTLIVFRFYRNCSWCDYIKSSNTKDVLSNNQLHQLMFQQLRTKRGKSWDELILFGVGLC